MVSLAPWLIALAAPLAMRVLAALGVGWVTYSGVDLILDALVMQISSALGGMSGAAGQLAGKMGLWDVIGIGLGALTTRLSLTALTRFAKL